MVIQQIFGERDEGSHWYHYDGRPAYEVPRADGSGMRKTTLRDARELGLVPSVTSILKVLHKPALQNWLAAQYVIAALTLPKFPSESYDDFARRVVSDANREGSEAADFGTRIHALIEWWLGAVYGLGNPTPEAPLTDEEAPFLKGFIKFAQEHKIVPHFLEKGFADIVLGYGGKVDFIGEYEGDLNIIDWKTKKTKPGEKLRTWPDWGPQLHAYANGLGMHDIPFRSVIVSSTEPGRVDTHLWTEQEREWTWETFLACRTIWYSPLGPGGNLLVRDEE